MAEMDLEMDLHIEEVMQETRNEIEKPFDGLKGISEE